MAITFTCTECNSVDVDTSPEANQTLCYECRTGEWHGLFEKERFDPAVHDSHNSESDFDDEYGSPSFS